MTADATSDNAPATTTTDMPRPLGDRVLVKQKAWSDKIGMIHIPQEHVLGYEERATVVAIGPKYPHRDEVSVGDEIIFRRQPASSLVRDPWEKGANWDGLLVLKAENVLAVVDD